MVAPDFGAVILKSSPLIWIEGLTDAPAAARVSVSAPDLLAVYVTLAVPWASVVIDVADRPLPSALATDTLWLAMTALAESVNLTDRVAVPPNCKVVGPE